MTKLGMKRTTPRVPMKRTALVRKPRAIRVRIDPLDALFSKYIRLRDGGNCQRCGCHVGLTEGLHCAHFIGRSNKTTRWDEDNAVALCFGCHQYFHSHPAEFVEWFTKRLGEQRLALLYGRARITYPKPDKQAIRIYLQTKVKELGG